MGSGIAADSAFGAEQFDANYQEGVEGHFWNIARAAIVTRHLKRVMKGANGLVLDVGCGPGLMVEHLRANGFDCEGVELGRPRVREAVRSAVTTGTSAEHLPAATRERVKVILLLDVVEHIPDPDAFLAGIKAAFPALQSIVMTLPACQELWSESDVSYGHHMRYGRRATRALASRVGFRMVFMRYFFRGLYPIMRLTTKAAPRQVTKPNGASAVFHKLAAVVFRIEERIPLPWPGTSLLAAMKV